MSSHQASSPSIRRSRHDKGTEQQRQAQEARGPLAISAIRPLLHGGGGTGRRTR